MTSKTVTLLEVEQTQIVMALADRLTRLDERMKHIDADYADDPAGAEFCRGCYTRALEATKRALLIVQGGV